LHVLCSLAGDLAEKELVQVPVVDREMGSALMVLGIAVEEVLRTYDQMPVGSIANQLGCKAIRRALQHAKSLAEDQVTHDIEHQPLAPVSGVPLITPAFVILSLLGRPALSSLRQ
jgi:hypothetical protein